MQLIVSADALKRKYGVNAQDVLRAIEAKTVLQAQLYGHPEATL